MILTVKQGLTRPQKAKNWSENLPLFNFDTNSTINDNFPNSYVVISVPTRGHLKTLQSFSGLVNFPSATIEVQDCQLIPQSVPHFIDNLKKRIEESGTRRKMWNLSDSRRFDECFGEITQDAISFSATMTS